MQDRAGRVKKSVLAIFLGLGLAGPVAGDSVTAQPASARGTVTNLPLPRYVSLKASEGNARRGPSLSHRIDWLFQHRNMPLRITAEFENWRRVEDRDGAGGWIHYTLLSGVRSVVVTSPMADLHLKPAEDALLVARAQDGVIAWLEACNADWCQIAADGQDGWVKKSDIWGVDADELRE